MTKNCPYEREGWRCGWEGALGENGYTYICMAESLPCSPETTATLLKSYKLPKKKEREREKAGEMLSRAFFL